MAEYWNLVEDSFDSNSARGEPLSPSRDSRARRERFTDERRREDEKRRGDYRYERRRDDERRRERDYRYDRRRERDYRYDRRDDDRRRERDYRYDRRDEDRRRDDRRGSPHESEEERKRRIRGEERRQERDEMENALTESEREQMKLDREERTVFVSNLPIRCHEEDLYDFFNQAGKVRDIRLIMEKGGRKSKGVGYVEYWDRVSIPSAIQLSGKALQGYSVQVAPTLAEKNRIFANPIKKQPTTLPIKSPHMHYTNPNVSTGTEPQNQIPDSRLYVGSLHFNVNEQQLVEIFSKYGPIEFINLHRDSETGRSKGFGFVQFQKLEDAKRAMAEVNGQELLGREMKVNMVTTNAGVENYNPNAPNVDLDDDDNVVPLKDQSSRHAFMQKLLRPQEASDLPVTVKPSSAPPPTTNAPPKIPAPSPSNCVLLKNMFDPENETEENWVEEIREDVTEECKHFGNVLKVGVDPNSKGYVFVKFSQIIQAQSAINSLHGRWFAGKQVTAEFFPEVLFDQYYK